jgi:hypothetical protein
LARKDRTIDEEGGRYHGTVISRGDHVFFLSLDWRHPHIPQQASIEKASFSTQREERLIAAVLADGKDNK